MSDELKPCPYCGSNDYVTVGRVEGETLSPDNFQVVCSWLLGGCGASGGVRRTEAEAIAAWNARADDAKVIKNAENYKLTDDSRPQVIPDGEKYELADSREKLNEELMDSCLTFANGGGHLRAFAYVSDLLDRQAAITRAEVFEDGEYDFMIDELTAERDHFRKHVNHMMALIADIARKQPYTFDPEAPYSTLGTIGDYLDELQGDVASLTAERDYWRDEVQYCMDSAYPKSHAPERGYDQNVMAYPDRNGCTTPSTLVSAVIDQLRDAAQDGFYASRFGDLVHLTAERDEWKTKCETREIAYKQADAERKRYSEQIDELTADRDQLSRDLDAEHALVVQFEYDNAKANDIINTLRASVAGLKDTVEKLREI